MSEHILVAGATGLVGFAAMKHFAEKGFKVTALSRRRPFETFGATHIPLDLTDRAACAEAGGCSTAGGKGCCSELQHHSEL